MRLNRIVRPLLLVALSALALPARAQDADSAKSRTELSGAVSVTNKGIATVPSLTLGKPAAIFDVVIRRGDLSFEPQFRFGLDGKPWSFLFWGRYRLVNGERLRVSVGAHPAISFRVSPASTPGSGDEVILARRYLAGELNPTYTLSRNVGVGAYWLYSYGVEKEVTRNTNLVAVRATLTSAALPDEVSLRITPQVYYLRMDERDGYYFNSGATLSKRDLPVTLSTTVTKALDTKIVGQDLLWNVSVNYTLP